MHVWGSLLFLAIQQKQRVALADFHYLIFLSRDGCAQDGPSLGDGRVDGLKKIMISLPMSE